MSECTHLSLQSYDKKREWNSIVTTMVHDIAEPAGCFGAEDAEQDGQSSSQVSREAARYAIKEWQHWHVIHH